MPRDLAMIPFTICQHDFDDRRIFQHRCHDKWSLLGNRCSDGFIHEETCLEFVMQLCDEWSPIKHLTRHLADHDWTKMAQLSGRQFDLIHVGNSRWPTVLGADGSIQEGRSHQETYWWRENNRIVLAGSDGKKSCVLKAVGDDAWEGRSSRRPETLIRLLQHGTPVVPA